MIRAKGYIRVSSDKQTVKNQEHAILKYCNDNDIKLEKIISVSASSRKSDKQRRIDELLTQLFPGEILIVSELSRLARSVGQIAIIVDKLLKNHIGLICIKENIKLDGHQDIQTKTMITMFSLFAEIERDLISIRTKEGLERARSEGKLLGRPKGKLGKSKLDGKEGAIQELLNKGVNIANLCRIFDVAWPTMDNFIKTRKLDTTN